MLLFRHKVNSYSIPLFISFWLGLEKLLLINPIGFPFYQLGRNLVEYSDLIQWYEYTGSLGGSFWILCINYCLYLFLENGNYKNITVVLVLPILFSLILNVRNNPINREVNVSILGTDLDCNTEKYTTNPRLDFLDFIPKHKIKEENQHIVLWPETTITSYVNIDNPTSNRDINKLKKIAKESNYLFLIGTISYNKNGEYNSMFYISRDTIQYRSKYKLVPINEFDPFTKMPFIKNFVSDPIKKFEFQKGKKLNPVFYVGENQIIPLICYEVLFEEYVRNFNRELPGIITVSLNEGWFKSKQGSKIFLDAARVQAITHKKTVITSSNKGYNAIIENNGKIGKKTFDYYGYLDGKVGVTNRVSFYTKNGDIIGGLALIFSATYLIFNIFFRFKNLFF